ncbi:transposase, partial [Mycobacterium tuberculosis]|uniref:transposase n=1 Tax=Mycobacterium tuberculosis TaxID=1773 RepID=UPI000A977739
RPPVALRQETTGGPSPTNDLITEPPRHYKQQTRVRQAPALLTVSAGTGVPVVLEELAKLGRTLWRCRHDVLAYFDHHASNGPTEAINGRLEALCRNALGFRNLTHYRIRSLLHCGNLAQLIHAL